MRPPAADATEPSAPSVGPLFATVRRPAPAGTARLILTGELDLVTAARARTAIRRAQDESRVLICDLGDLWFIDLTGLRVLLGAAAHAERTGRRLLVANAPPILSRMLRFVGLDDALELPAMPLRTPPVHACESFRRHVS